MKPLSMAYSSLTSLAKQRPEIFIVELEVLWKIISETSENPFVLIEAIFSESNPQMDDNCTSILLDFAVVCLESGCLTEACLSSLFHKLENLFRLKTRTGLEKYAYILRILRGSNYQNIRRMAEDYHKKLKNDEIIKKKNHEGLLNILELSPIIMKANMPIKKFSDCTHEEEILHEAKGKLSEYALKLKQERLKGKNKVTINDLGTSNIKDIPMIIGRVTEVNHIHECLQNNNFLALTGSEGVGKSSVALKYALEFMYSFQIVWKINCVSEDSVHFGLASLAKKLGLKNKNQVDIFASLNSRLEGSKKLILIIFDNVKCYETILKFCCTNRNVHHLVTTTSLIGKREIQIDPFSSDTSNKLLRYKIGIPKNPNEMNKLSKYLSGSPLLIELIAGVILTNKYQVARLVDELVGISTIEEKIQAVLKLQFSDLSMHCISILEILSVCTSQKIPEYMIRHIFLQENTEADWLSSRSILINSFIVSLQGEYYNIHGVVSEYVEKRFNLKNKQNIIDFYSREFIVQESYDSDLIQKIIDLKPHVEKLINSFEIVNSKEMIILINLANFYIRISCNTEQFIESLRRIRKISKLQNSSNEDFGGFYHFLGLLYYNHNDKLMNNNKICYRMTV